MIIFASANARKHLLEKNFVWTFRVRKRRLQTPGAISHDWATDHRGGKKLCDVSIQNEREINHWDQLSAYVFGSGFETVTEWKNEITQLNEHAKRWELKKPLGWVYLVSKRV